MTTPFGSRRSLSILLLTTVLGLGTAACNDGDVDAEAADAGADATAKEAPARFDLAGASQAAAVFVLPAPSEIAQLLDETENQAALQAALAEPPPSYGALPPWRRALAVGRVLADMLIAAPAATDAEIAEYLDGVAAGLASLGAGDDRLAQIHELRDQVAGGAFARDDLLDQFDKLRVEILREGEAQVGEQNMALISVGGWARAVNLVAGVAEHTGEVPPGADMLKLRVVVAHLIDEVGGGEEVRPVVDALEAILPVTARRPTQPTAEEIATLKNETRQILSLTRVS